MRNGYLVCLSLGICLLLQVQHAHAKENKTDPTDNVNLTPFRAWRSAYYCLQRKAPANCTAFETVSLTDRGLIDVIPSGIGEYCSADTGCAQHVLDVLKCIYLCKRDFWFANNATVSVLNQTIHDGCSNKKSISTLNRNYKKSSGMKVQQKIYTPFVASLSTLAFIAIFNM
ncbi:hypothetical protein RchiOBHm_Chr5g0073511 [Rosa chinensis]|uniref:DUF7731 domain-containing protein n=1 Tax=Rosa chinensis TaxID=74649 RepID=A0A2P6QKZ8_ROSCH|nr:uncharacterized protein LOC112201488 [Rosa chinensis]PRQ34839.1 hypothetical protein RchiOBHm_Chr5g0073511 [Rosa chinensis]